MRFALIDGGKVRLGRHRHEPYCAPTTPRYSRSTGAGSATLFRLTAGVSVSCRPSPLTSASPFASIPIVAMFPGEGLFCERQRPSSMAAAAGSRCPKRDLAGAIGGNGAVGGKLTFGICFLLWPLCSAGRPPRGWRWVHAAAAPFGRPERTGAVSSASISSIVRPRVSIAMNAKASAPSTYHEAK